MFKNDTWVKPYLKQYKRSLILAIFLGIIAVACEVGLMFNSGYLISKSASLPINILLVYVPIVLTRTFGIGRPVFRYLERLVSHNWVLKMTSNLRRRLYVALEPQAVFFNQKYRTGDVLGLLSEDINHIQNLYLRVIFPTIIGWTLYVVVVILTGFFSIFFGLSMLVLFGFVVFAIPMWSVAANGARHAKAKVMRNNLYGNLTDNVLGISDWIFSQRGHDYVELHEKSEAELHEVRDRLLRFKRYRDLIVQVVFGTIVIVTLFWTGNSFQGVHGSGMTNWIAAFVLGIFPLINSFEPLSQAAEESSTYQDSIYRFNELPDETEKATAIESLTGPLTIAIDHLDFSYDNSSKQILKDLNIQIAPGEKIAILGKSGSGKSTLTHLLHGDLEPTNGQVTINDIKTNVLNDDIDRYIGVINQAPYLFNTTIANNLRIGDEAASDDKLWDVLDRVGLKEMIQKLPNGLGTLVDEAGLRFSGGERHRLSLARILLKDVPIIILDEPTVGLDPITEQGLINTFFNQLEGKTVIWVTHHLQGVDSMDKVIFIEDGQIEMQGTPTELNQTNQRFRELKAIDAGF